ncbi:MAG: hypothetical protein AAF612_12715, partial [Planctomycetota bacterium]
MDTVTGILELSGKADGRLRQLDGTYVAEPSDPVIPSHLIEKHGLRAGLKLKVTLGKPVGGQPQPAQQPQGGGKKGKKKKNKNKFHAVAPDARRAKTIDEIEDAPAEEFKLERSFEDLTTIMPQPRLDLEHPDCPPACRLMDLFCPIGYGTRGMIVSPPKAGKTTLLQNIAFALQKNHPDAIVIALLIDERPEEVTDFRRNVPCIVWASSNDHVPERHCGLAMLASERCKRWAEMGKDVIVLMDSLTRL